MFRNVNENIPATAKIDSFLVLLQWNFNLFYDLFIFIDIYVMPISTKQFIYEIKSPLVLRGECVVLPVMMMLGDYVNWILIYHPLSGNPPPYLKKLIIRMQTNQEISHVSLLLSLRRYFYSFLPSSQPIETDGADFKCSVPYLCHNSK